MPTALALPNDIEQLKQLVMEQQAALVARDAALKQAQEQLHSRQLQIEHLKLTIARLTRLKFGRSSEQLDQQIAQLELRLEELESEAPIASTTTASSQATSDEVIEPVPSRTRRSLTLALAARTARA